MGDEPTGYGPHWFEDVQLLKAVMAGLADAAAFIEERVLATGGSFGYCRGCRSWGWLSQSPAVAGDWANLMEGLICKCGLNGRMRGILMAVDGLLQRRTVASSRAAVFECLTPLYPFLEERLPGLVGSEYLGDDLVSGQVLDTPRGKVRHESLLAPSFEDGSLELVMHFDVLEHVPDMDKALRQCWRVLRPGGWMLFSCPFYEALETTIVRARLVNGELCHDLAPCFHGNPVDGGGALVFSQPGWDLWGRVRQAGFKTLGVSLCFDPVQGVLSDACPYPDGHAWPLVFAAQK